MAWLSASTPPKDLSIRRSRRERGGAAPSASRVCRDEHFARQQTGEKELVRAGVLAGLQLDTSGRVKLHGHSLQRAGAMACPVALESRRRDRELNDHLPGAVVCERAHDAV